MAGILFVGLVAYPLLPVAPLPQVDFPTIQVSAPAARRQPGDHGLVGRPAAGAPVRADPRRHADDLDQRRSAPPRSPCSSISTATSTPPPTTSRPRSTPPAGSCRRTCRRPPTYRKVNPADSPILLLSATSDTLPLTEVDDNADTKLAQQISQISGVAQVIIGGQQKPAIRIQIDPAKLVAKGLSLEDVRSQLAITHRQQPEGQHRRRQARSYTIYANDQLTERRRTGTTSSSPIATARPCAIRDIGQAVAGPGGRQAGGLGQRQARRVPGRLQAARRQRHRDRRPHQGDAAAAASRRCRRPSRSRSSATARRPSAPRSRTCSSRCC